MTDEKPAGEESRATGRRGRPQTRRVPSSRHLSAHHPDAGAGAGAAGREEAEVMVPGVVEALAAGAGAEAEIAGDAGSKEAGDAGEAGRAAADAAAGDASGDASAASAREQRDLARTWEVLASQLPPALLRRDTDADGWRAFLSGARRRTFGRRSALVFLAAIGCALAVNLAVPDKDFSDSENRLLTQLPQATRASIASGDFMEKAEDYVSDQFVGRDAWVSLKLTLERLAGRRESNGVYLGRDGMLFEEPEEPAWDDVAANMQAMDDFAARHADLSTYFCLVPNAFSVQGGLLPADAPVRDQQADIDRVFSMASDQVTCFDAGDALRGHADEYIYYRTDHHWTSLGASYAFQALAPVMGIDPAAASYDTLLLTRDFQGTLASKSGYHGSRDSIEAYHPAGEAGSYVVEYSDDGTSTSVFDTDKLQDKDKYQVFLGGNHPRVTIYTTATGKRNLLVLKDSYANCFIPFLLPYFESITVVDPRYYYEDIDSLVAANSVTDVLFLYNENTFGQDDSLAQAIAPAS